MRKALELGERELIVNEFRAKGVLLDFEISTLILKIVQVKFQKNL